MNLIDRYVGRGVFITALYGVFVLSFVLVLGNVFKELLDLLINRDIPLHYVLLFILYVLPFSLTFTLPWGFLTAVLLIFGRMSADNELIALRACGVSLRRVCIPVLLVGAALCVFTFWINAKIAPLAEMAMRDSIATMARTNPAALFIPDEIVDQFQGKKIYVGSKNGDELSEVTLIEENDNGSPVRIIYAHKGFIESDQASGELMLTLRDAKFEQRDEKAVWDYGAIRHGISVQEVTIHIPLEDLVADHLRGRPLRSYTLGELWLQLPTAKDLVEKVAVMSEISKRFSMSLASLAFALIAIPLGITAQRKETSVGFGISLALAFTYFFFVVLAEMLRGNVNAYPYLLIWIPNVLFISIGSWLLMRLDYR